MTLWQSASHYTPASQRWPQASEPADTNSLALAQAGQALRGLNASSALEWAFKKEVVSWQRCALFSSHLDIFLALIFKLVYLMNLTHTHP